MNALVVWYLGVGFLIGLGFAFLWDEHRMDNARRERSEEIGAASLEITRLRAQVARLIGKE